QRRLLRVIDRDGERARRSVGRGVRGRAGHGRRPFREGRAGGRSATDGHAGAVVAGAGGGVVDHRRALARIGGPSDVGRTGERRVLSVVDGDREAAGGEVAGPIGGRATDLGGAIGEDRAGGWSATEDHRAGIGAAVL